MDDLARRLMARPMDRRSFLAASGLGLGAVALASCAGGAASPGATASASAAPSAAPSYGPIESELLLYERSGRGDPDNRVKFKAQYGLSDVRSDRYANDEQLIAKLQGRASGYDIAAPTAEYVPGMVQQGFIQRLDLARIPNARYIDTTFKGLAWDPTDEYQVPKDHGTTGILYRGKLVSDAPTSWRALYDGIKGEWSRQTIFVDSMTDVLAFPLKMLGYSLNSVDPKQLEEARQILLDVAPHILALDSDTYGDRLAREEAAICLGWAGPLAALRADAATADTAYLVPSEGSLFWIETWVMIADAPHPNASYAWLNFIQEPQTQADETDYTGYATCNAEAKKLVDPGLLDDPAVFPPDDIVARLEGAQDTSSNSQRLDIWAEFRSKTGQG